MSLPGEREAAAPSGSRWARNFFLAATAAYLAYRTGLPAVRLPLETPPPLLIAAFVLTAIAAIGLPVAMILGLVRQSMPRGGALALTAAGLVLWLTLTRLPPHPVAAALMDLGKILAASGAGIALAAAIREPNILFPAGLFAAFADFVVVNFGTVHHALQSSQGRAVVQAVSAAVPAVHPTLGGLTIGPADFLFLGIFLACAARFDLGLRRNAVVLTLVLGLSLAAVPLVGPVPALAPMSLAFVLLNCRDFRLSRQEILSTVAVLLVAGGLFLGYFLLYWPRRGATPPATPGDRSAPAAPEAEKKRGPAPAYPTGSGNGT